jgi:PAS domain S-box-containing protein
MGINDGEYTEKDVDVAPFRRTENQPSKWWFVLGFGIILLTLFIISRINFLIFHTLAELFAILVAWSLFVILWNTKNLIENKALVFLGIAYLFVGGIDLVHTLSYSGMGFLEPERGANPATQLWILARYVESISLFLFPVLFFRQIDPYRVFGIFALITLVGISSIVHWDIFPACYIDGIGLTTFKKASEYIICTILVAALVFLRKKKAGFDPLVYQYMVIAVILTICAELAFTFYVSVYGLSNLVGHFFKIVSFYCIYRALIRSGLAHPHSVLFDKLKKSEKKFRLMAENMSDVITLMDMNLGFTYVSPSIKRLTGFSVEEALTFSMEDIIPPDSFQEILNIIKEEITAEAAGKNDPDRSRIIEYKQYKKDKSIVWVESSCRFLRDKDQKPSGLLVISRDITERKQAEMEKEKLQDQLLQAQKMESIGRLAGGVAHDFNNMLGVILGHAEFALEKAKENHDLYADLNAIQTAARRSADLTKQLLTFARKQIIDPRMLDLNNTVESMLSMLRRLIGEDINLVWQPAKGLWPVKMDPSQIDQILVNLCVNARDAIAGVGKLTIETGMKIFDSEYCADHAGFIPGDFAMLAVSDNGCGMDKEILNNLFEPFFTTKDVGEGTGLGLATIYGIVKQNNGFVNVYSEPDQGSIFRIYLPRYVAPDEIPAVVHPEKSDPTGNETILLVEDEPTILRMTRMMLERRGYRVLSAATPGEAIDLAKTHADKIHLLMTDVVMPEMNGRDLAGQLTALCPDIKLLFMSGYTANVIAHHGVLDEGVAFIQKPFSMKELAEKLRRVLDEAPGKTHQ